MGSRRRRARLPALAGRGAGCRGWLPALAGRGAGCRGWLPAAVHRGCAQRRMVGLVRCGGRGWPAGVTDRATWWGWCAKVFARDRRVSPTRVHRPLARPRAPAFRHPAPPVRSGDPSAGASPVAPDASKVISRTRRCSRV